MKKKTHINWSREKALLGWLMSEKHKEFLAKEFSGSTGAMKAFYKTKKYIIEERSSNFIKDYTYDKFLKEFKDKKIQPDVI